MTPKQERRRLAQEEKARRERAREAHAPLTRGDLDDLYAFVAQRVFDDGIAGGWTLTREWLQGHPAAEAVLSFFQAQGVQCDWDVLIDADPHRLFGPTATRLARMPLEQGELGELIEWLEDAIPAEGCQHDLRLTRSWLDSRGLPVALVEFALVAQGGGCDCEVVLNVDPSRIYPDSTVRVPES